MDPVTAYKTVRTVDTVRRAVPWKRIILASFVVCTVAFGAIFLTLTSVLGGKQQQTTTSGACVQLQAGTTVDDLTQTQTAAAATIRAVAAQVGAGDEGAIVGIAVAMQESQLDPTLTEAQSDRDSFGLFQQRRPWGPGREAADSAARMFYTGGAGGQPGLLSIPGWQQLPVTVAGQRVQRSAFPNAYAQWEGLARAVVAELAGAASAAVLPVGYAAAAAGCTATAAAAGWTPLAGASAGETAVNNAARWIGTPYAWGGGTVHGPSEGFAQGAGTVGFDCSGLILHAWYQSSGIQLPHSAAGIAATTASVTTEELAAGDVLSFSDGGQVTHDGLYDGRGGMVHAPRTGKSVEHVADVLDHPYWAPRLVAATRPASDGPA